MKAPFLLGIIAALVFNAEYIFCLCLAFLLRLRCLSCIFIGGNREGCEWGIVGFKEA